ncbi:MAG TPA: hypothetical protein VFM98_04645 [Ramlibacter sp.]|nr:hypothetical protein [Ramlibacter sp.]HET8744867.1 hypothetical protein [Ramlibacter sp.]
MGAVLLSAILAAIARVLNQRPRLHDLLRAMNSEDALRDGSRYL